MSIRSEEGPRVGRNLGVEVGLVVGKGAFVGIGYGAEVAVGQEVRDQIPA